VAQKITKRDLAEAEGQQYKHRRRGNVMALDKEEKKEQPQRKEEEGAASTEK